MIKIRAALARRATKLRIWAILFLILASGFIPAWLAGNGRAGVVFVIGLTSGFAFLIWAEAVERRGR